jgi:WD40 repeat protein
MNSNAKDDLANVYVSYATAEKEFVRSLDEAFRQRQRRIYIDWSNAPLTAEIEKEIRSRIAAADYFVIVISPDSITSPRCLQELALASEQKKRLVPILRYEVPPAALPEALRGLGLVSFRRGDDFNQAIGVLLRTLAAELRLSGFVSYSRKDQVFVDKLDDAFKTSQRKVWIDRKEIRHTEEWLQAIYSGIEAADNFIFIISEDSVTSKNCGKEIAHAAKYNKRFVPVLYRNPLSPVPADVARYQNVLFPDGADFEAGFTSLIDAIDTDLEYVSLHTWLTTRANEWQRNQEDNDFLLRGDELRRAQKWFAQVAPDKKPAPALQQERFVGESSRQAGRRRFITIAASALILITVTLISTFGVNRMREARRQRSLALSRQLAAIARSHFADQLDLALLLTLEAQNIADTPEARSVLLEALQQQPRLVALLGHRSGRIASLAYSPDGKFVAAGSEDKTVTLWNVKTHQLEGPPLLHDSTVNTLAFPVWGDTLAVGAGNQIVIWDTAKRQRKAGPITTTRGEIVRVAFTSDDKTLVSCSSWGAVAFWNSASLESLQTWELGDTLHGFGLSRDGKLMAIASWDRVTIWDVLKHRLLRELSTEQCRGIKDVAFSPDSKSVATACADGTILLSDPATGASKGEPLKGHSSGVNSMRFSVDSNGLITAGDDGQLISWDLDTRKTTIPALAGNRLRIASVAIDNSGGDVVATGDAEGNIMLWDTDPRKSANGPLAGRPFYGGASAVHSIAFRPDGRTLAGGYQNGSLLLFDLATSHAGRLPFEQSTAVTSIAFTADGTRLASGLQDRNIILWDVPTQKVIKSAVAGDAGVLTSMAFSPERKLLAVGVSAVRSGGSALTGFRLTAQLSTILLFDADTLQTVGQPLTVSDRTVRSVAFSRDGKVLAGGLDNGEIRLWNSESREQIGGSLKSSPQSVETLAFNPSGSLLAAGGGELTVTLWDIASRKPAAGPLLVGHKGIVKSISFSPDGSLLASGGQDETVILWDVATRQRIGLPLKGHFLPVESVAFSPDGRTLASGSQDTDINLWSVSLEDWRRRACEKANRNLTEAEWGQYLVDRPYRPTCLPKG